MSTENGTPVVQPFDFSQDNWQADIKHLDATQRELFLKAMELEFPDLRWNSGDKPSECITCYDFLFRGFFGGCNLTYGSTQTCFAHATQAQVTLFISEYLDKVEKIEKELVPVGVIHDDGVCSLIEMGVKPPSLHLPGAKDDTMKTSGSKYHREIRDIKGRLCHVKQSGEFVPAVIDVYCVLDAFDVRKPAMQHMNKKTLCAGIRGKGSMLQDLKEARDALTRQIDELENGGMEE